MNGGVVSLVLVLCGVLLAGGVLWRLGRAFVAGRPDLYSPAPDRADRPDT
ncbi:hypothetical protein [uncultured Tateyamaria sp.]|nr:hypothetical protein [uncultured Tateyamaria sp.]